MTIRRHVCSLDPCARWKPQPARIFVAPCEVDGSCETSLCTQKGELR